MSHGEEEGQSSSLISGFNRDANPVERRRSASPHSSATQRTSGVHALGRDSGRNDPEDEGPQLVGRNLDLHPSLQRWIEDFGQGKAGRTRVMGKGSAYIEGLANISDGEKDRLIVEFSEAVDGSDRREKEGELGGRGEERRGEAREAEANRPNWLEGGGNGELKRGDKSREFWPWQSRTDGPGNEYNPSQQATHEALELYNADLTLAERRVTSAPGAPKHFPYSEWCNILRGRSVDLNRVFASQFVSRPVPEDVARVGGVEIRVPGRERSKKIQTSADWVIAWGATVEATAFAFPHRQAELNQHTAYMLQKFRRKNATHHPRIIVFDEALREAVGGGENSSLLDPNLRENFSESILQPNGAEYFSYPRRNEGGICNNFNSKSGCSNNTCSYQHKCRRCKEEGHGQSNCTKSRTGGERAKP